MVGFEELGRGDELFVAHPDPVVLELNKLQNQLKEKERELGVAHTEIKALRATEVLKDKAVEEFSNEVNKLDEKLSLAENLLEQKNLEIKKLTSEKKDALLAQFAAEATLRRVYANQKDNDCVPIASIIAPLEADIKMYKNEIAALQEDKKAMERLNKSKELALLEAEKILRSALERALIVEEVQNQNFELKRQIEICQEENRILDKTNRQKVSEVEKLSQTIQQLEEAILAGGAAANAIRDYQRQISELNEEKKTLERELARVKVSANRVATVVANEWKDENDKVMPVKQWLEDRRLLQAEMQRLRDKLAVSERTAKAEAQLKPRASAIIRGSPLQQPGVENETANAAGELKQVSNLKKKSASGENMLRKSLLASRFKVVDSGEKENSEVKANTDLNINKYKDNDTAVPTEIKTKCSSNKETQTKGCVNGANVDSEDMVSGFLYDRLQREVINLRKSCEVKESSLNAKDEEINVLMRKVDALTKAIEAESRRMKREAAAREKEESPKVDENKKIKNAYFSKSRVTKAS
ncbi:hypothetical protein L1049_010185 [Liquidambar formosana]|uniref:Microtubule-associated protein 70-5 n=1 Tax=Liquidambar formosana TaxID=63359 RepID=A0AAP0R6U2_LIQFO